MYCEYSSQNVSTNYPATEEQTSKTQTSVYTPEGYLATKVKNNGAGAVAQLGEDLLSTHQILTSISGTV